MTVNAAFFKNNRAFIAFILITIIGFFSWRVYHVQIEDPLDRILLDPPRSLTPFHLVAGDNKPFTLEQLKGKWTFLFFGYTSCPDVCPTTLTEMATMSNLLAKSTELNTLQFVFISVDPERDSPEHLKNFVAYFNETFTGVTGTIDQLNTLTGQINIKHRRLEKQGNNYLVEHSADILLFDPQARLFARFPAPHYSEEISALFTEILELNKDI
jgi:protein SCO1/2